MAFYISGVRVKIDFLFAALVTILLCFNTGDEVRLGIFFSILHEAGHLTAIISFKEKPETVRFGLFGMTIIRKSDISQDYKKEIITALAGPFTNFFLCALLYLMYLRFPNEYIMKSVFVNLLMGTFNIMPVFSLDGGRALESLLKMNFDADKSDRIIKAVSFAVLVFMMGIGFYILIESGYNFTFLLITVYLAVMLFIKG